MSRAEKYLAPFVNVMTGWPIVLGPGGRVDRVCPCGGRHPDPHQFPGWAVTGEDWRALHVESCCDRNCCVDGVKVDAVPVREVEPPANPLTLPHFTVPL